MGAVLFAVGSFAAWNVLGQRAGPGRHLARPVDPARRQGLPARAEHLRPGVGEDHRHRASGLGDPTRIPEVKNDFIFAAFGEELGLLGGTAMIVAYLLMVGSGLRIAIQAERTFEKLLATGLTTILGVQAFVIIGGVTRVVPLTGVTLPFVSYGGSSLLANYILLALLMRIADSSAQFSGDIPRRITWRQRRAERRADRAEAAEKAGAERHGAVRGREPPDPRPSVSA